MLAQHRIDDNDPDAEREADQTADNRRAPKFCRLRVSP
jgi:hypothetical protein